MDFEKDKAYMEVLHVFRRLIEAEYENGGWLAPTREMSARLHVNPLTYRKATNRLVEEGIADSFPRKGIYIIPAKYRPRKIGLVVGNGEESPFLFHTATTREIFKRLEERGYYCHLLQGSSGMNVARSALSHCVDGVIWLIPHLPDYKGIIEIQKHHFFPYICVQYSWPKDQSCVVPDDVPYVSEDYAAIGSKLAKPFIARGHKKIVWAGASSFLAEYIGLGAACRQNGLAFDESYCVEDHIHNPGDISRMVMNEGATGIIIAGGGIRNVEYAFRELSELPDKMQPEVLIWNDPESAKLRAEYPSINVIATAQDDKQNFGKNAVDILLDHLGDPENISISPVKSFRVDSI